MSMPPERRAAIALLIGVLAPLLIMGMHPTGGDITRGGARLVTINHWVHGVSLAAQPVVFLGLLGLWRSVRSDLATAALLFYGFGIVAILSAAVLSGFVAPDVVADRLLLGYTGMLNQAFAKVSVAAIGASLILWGAALWPIGGRSGFARLPAAAGVMIGAVLALGILTGWLRLTVRGIVIVTLLQGIWILLVVRHLLRGGLFGKGSLTAAIPCISLKPPKRRLLLQNGLRTARARTAARPAGRSGPRRPAARRVWWEVESPSAP